MDADTKQALAQWSKTGAYTGLQPIILWKIRNEVEACTYRQCFEYETKSNWNE